MALDADLIFERCFRENRFELRASVGNCHYHLLELLTLASSGGQVGDFPQCRAIPADLWAPSSMQI